MNQVERIFLMVMDIKDKREKLHELNKLYRLGQRIIKLNREFGMDTKELEQTQQEFKALIEKL